MEQISECVIRLTKDQKKFVPWLICLEKAGETEAGAKSCAEKDPTSINYDDVTECVKVNGTQILADLTKEDAKIQATPTVLVNGKKVTRGMQDPTYKKVKQALCKADPSLKACSKEEIVV